MLRSAGTVLRHLYLLDRAIDLRPRAPQRPGPVLSERRTLALDFRPMEAHQQRVVDEHAELERKLAALDQFIQHNPAFETLATEDQALLCQQFDAMLVYGAILMQRISRFPAATA